MSFKEDMQEDLDIFYDADEFAYLAQYKTTTNTTEIPVNIRDGLEFESIDISVISAKTSDVTNLEVGHLFTINKIQFKCLNFEHQIDGLETIINISRK
jgi:hypothetical protein